MPANARSAFRPPAARHEEQTSQDESELETLPAHGDVRTSSKEELEGRCRELSEQLQDAQQRLSSMGTDTDGLGASTQNLLSAVETEVGPARALELRMIAKAQAGQQQAMTLMAAMLDRMGSAPQLTAAQPTAAKPATKQPPAKRPPAAAEVRVPQKAFVRIPKQQAQRTEPPKKRGRLSSSSAGPAEAEAARPAEAEVVEPISASTLHELHGWATGRVGGRWRRRG